MECLPRYLHKGTLCTILLQVRDGKCLYLDACIAKYNGHKVVLMYSFTRIFRNKLICLKPASRSKSCSHNKYLSYSETSIHKVERNFRYLAILFSHRLMAYNKKNVVGQVRSITHPYSLLPKQPRACPSSVYTSMKS